MKTYEEIVKNCRQSISELKAPNCDGTYEDSELKRDAIIYHELIAEACEKQIPAPPERRSDEYDGEYGYCPSCDGIITDYSDMRVCRHCGKKIQWQEGWVWK